MRSLGPWVCGCLWIQIQPYVAQLVDPTQQIAIFVRIASAFATAHGNTQNVAFRKFLHSSECSNLAIIDNFERDVSANLFRDSRENVNNFCLVYIRWDIRKNITPSSLIVRSNRTSCTAPHCIDFRKRRFRKIQCIHYGLEVVVWIWVCYIPLSLFRIYHFSVLYSYSLDVTLTKIKCQATTIGLLSAHLWGVLSWWQLGGLHNLHLKWLIRSSADIRHRHGFELILSSFRVSGLQRFALLRRPRQQETRRTSLPNHLLDQNASQINGSFYIFVAISKHR
mmetsp:Transcript_70350/g.111602  ORF Transcript_70350/g.111602 Transcript_70350/m.111602 type:complete len:280 (+) Transcript_70350:253-1092(+)